MLDLECFRAGFDMLAYIRIARPADTPQPPQPPQPPPPPPTLDCVTI